MQLEQLREWLAEAAKQLYGPHDHTDLTDRTAAVLRNSMLTSTVFAAFAAEDGGRAAGIVGCRRN